LINNDPITFPRLQSAAETCDRCKANEIKSIIDFRVTDGYWIEKSASSVSFIVVNETGKLIYLIKFSMKLFKFNEFLNSKNFGLLYFLMPAMSISTENK
jgi:hypothetical protein